ncbi:ABC transporter ATP-binding protein [Parasalinivibrio latis]|uniref:ABC transporter ATP-binding protein n=1 Tax=Parasalinivibrio latis TaxID=2952610 RepID=UPI0030E502F8
MAFPVIDAKQLVKQVTTSDHELTILDDVSLTVNEGESLALVGVSGAGKSTLMTLLAGLDVPTGGEVHFLGRRIDTLDDESRAAIRADSVGFVFQSFLLVPSLTALENVVLPATIRGDEEDWTRARQLLEEVGLAGREHHRPDQLSGGEQQRVALARAFMTKPQVLFADEPTGNLDQHTAGKVIELLFALNRDHGTTLVMVTHDPKLADRCDRKLVLDSGRIVQEGV